MLSKRCSHRATAHGRSEEAELRAILEEALCGAREPVPRPDRADDFWERAAELREELRGRTFTPSEDLIRRIGRKVMLVIDASVALKWVLPEADSDRANCVTR